MDIDGFWFLSMKDRVSNEEAIACDNWVWGRVVKKMLDDLAQLIGVEGRDVVDFMRVIQATPLHYVVEEKMEAQKPQPGHAHRHPLPNTGSAGERRCGEGCPALQDWHARSHGPDTPSCSIRRWRSNA